MSAATTALALFGPASRNRAASAGSRKLMSPKASTMPRLAKIRFAITRSLTARLGKLMAFPVAITVSGTVDSGVAGWQIRDRCGSGYLPFIAGNSVMTSKRRQSRHRRPRPLGEGADARRSASPNAIEIVAGYSRSEEKRAAFRGGIRRCRRARPRRPCWPIPRSRASSSRCRTSSICRSRAKWRKAGKHVYTEKPIAQHAGGRPRDRGAGKDLRRDRHGRPQRAADGRHPPHPRGDRCRRARPRRLHGGEFLQRARARTHAEDVALVQGPGARRAAVAARDPPVRRAALSRRRDRRGELDGVEALAGRRRGRRPVDDAAQVRRRQDRLCRRRAGRRPAFSRCACSARRARCITRSTSAPGTRRRSCTRPRRSTSSAARTATAKREEIAVPESDMFRAELDMFAESCRSGKVERAHGAQRQCRGRGGLCGAALDRAAGPGTCASPT